MRFISYFHAHTDLVFELVLERQSAKCQNSLRSKMYNVQNVKVLNVKKIGLTFNNRNINVYGLLIALNTYYY